MIPLQSPPFGVTTPTEIGRLLAPLGAVSTWIFCCCILSKGPPWPFGTGWNKLMSLGRRVQLAHIFPGMCLSSVVAALFRSLHPPKLTCWTPKLVVCNVLSPFPRYYFQVFGGCTAKPVHFSPKHPHPTPKATRLNCKTSICRILFCLHRVPPYKHARAPLLGVENDGDASSLYHYLEDHPCRGKWLVGPWWSFSSPRPGVGLSMAYQWGVDPNYWN